MPTLPPFSRVTREAICAFEALRRLGFVADDIFICAYLNGVRVELRSQGKEFNVEVGTVAELPAWKAECNAAIAHFNEAKPDSSEGAAWQAAYEASAVLRRSVEFLTKIKALGFHLPVDHQLYG